MANIKRGGNLDISEDMDFERREWLVERVGWVIMALLLIAALLGLLGRGPLTRKQAVDINSASWIEYYSIDHYEAPTQLKVHLGPSVISGEALRVSLNRDYLERIELDRIMPEPASEELAGESVVFVFDVVEPGQSQDILFQFTFAEFGRAAAQLSVEGGPQLSFSQLVLP